ncbi:AT-rich interactive domain-containing protein 2 [Linum perenne]
MERWLIRSFSDEQLGHHSERKRKGSYFSLDLETKLRSLLGDGKTGKERGNSVGLDSGKCELGLLGKMNPCRPANGFHIRNNDDDDENINGGYGNYGDIAVDQEMTHNDLGEEKSRKRKRISVSKLLRWIRQAAVCPIDHAAVSTSYDKRGNDLKALAIRARDFLVGETGFDLNVGQRSSKKSEDINTSQAVEKLRCSERLPALQQSRSRSVPNGNAKDITSRTNGVVDSPLTKGTTPLKHDHIPVRIHSRYQVRVPKWTGEVCESDDKWLGTKVWPLEDAADTSKQVSVMMSRIGKGRPASCRCQIPGSVSCVRFHTAERRMKLKLELGSAFFRCGFHQMGEEISLRWTPEEEQSFKEMVSRNRPSQERCFWDYAHQFLPGRTRRELVSYYFNVFQLQRRSYQNRATPDDIDSDDDQKEFGSFSSGYGHHAIEVRQMNEEVCSLNKQLTDYP